MFNIKSDNRFKKVYVAYRFCGKLQRRYFYTKHFGYKFFESLEYNRDIRLRRYKARY